MAISVNLSARDLSLLKLLSWTPATTTLLFQASTTFDGEQFPDERRLRERLLALCRAGLVRSWSTAHAGGGLENYYKLTMAGFVRLHGPDAMPPKRAFFAEISPALFEHTLRLAEAIVTIVRGSNRSRVTIQRFFRENELTFTAGDAQVQPDAFLSLTSCGKTFNIALEIDMSNESVDSHAVNSLREKLHTYNDYQSTLLANWHASGRSSEQPRFRVVFLTRSVARAYHILALAGQMSPNRRRRFVYAATHESFSSEPDPLRTPVFLDHSGHWQALIDLHPTSVFQRTPVRWGNLVDQTHCVW